MSFYNMLFGMNAQADLLLAVIGLKRCDVERFRDVSTGDGRTIDVYTRTGGGNRSDYPNLTMRKRPEWQGSEDDDFDSTYCTDTFAVPEQWVQDVAALSDHGLRAEFARHLAETLRREPTEADQATAAYEAERAKLERTRHVKANGHTFVPYDDNAMLAALEIAEENGGELRTAWGILPLKLEIKTDFVRWPNAVNEDTRAALTRWDVNYKWEIDEAYWQHCRDRFAARFPKAMAKITESVDQHRKAA